MKRAGIIFFFVTLFLLWGPIAAGSAPAEAPQANSLIVGYAAVTPLTDSTSDLLLFENFSLTRGSAQLLTNTAVPQLVTSAQLFVSLSSSLGRNVGLAIVNPNDSQAVLTMTLRRDDGIAAGVPQTVFIAPRRQISQFVTELFSSQPNLPTELTGTLSISSTVPVSVLAVRFQGASFTIEPLAKISASATLAQILPGVGASGSFILPDFVQGEGWATQIVLVNTGASDITVRVDLFTPSGDFLTASLNGQSASTFFNLRIRAGGVLVLAPPNSPF